MRITPTTQERLERRLAHYVAMPTVSSDVSANKAGLQVLAKELEDVGLKPSIHGEKHPWLIATTRPSKHVRLLLHAHFDVVPENEEGQFAMRTDDDRLIGRGVFDMKFAAAIYIEVLSQLAKHDGLKAYNVGVLFTTDEEVGGRNGVKEFLEEGWRCDIAIIPDGGRDFKIERRAKGFLYAHLDAKGMSAHGSRPWEADNPIPKLIPALKKILEFYPNNDSAKPTVSITGIETPSAFTQIPHLARARLDARAFEEKDLENIIAFLQSVANEHGLTLNIELYGSPVHLQVDHPLVQSFVACQAEVLGRPTEFIDSLGASDARYFAEYGIPTIVEYPHGGNAHSDGEWLSRDSFATFYTLIKLYVERTAHDPHTAPARHLFTTPGRMVRSLLKR